MNLPHFPSPLPLLISDKSLTAYMHLIYHSKLNKPTLSISLFLEKCKRIIARRNKKLFLHNRKWKLLPLLE